MAWRIRQKWMKAIHSYVHDIPSALSFRKYGNSSKQHHRMISKFWPWKHIPVNVRSVWSFYGLCFFPVQSGSIPELSVYSTNFSKFQILHQHFPLPIRYIDVTDQNEPLCERSGGYESWTILWILPFYFCPAGRTQQKEYRNQGYEFQEKKTSLPSCIFAVFPGHFKKLTIFSLT